MSKVIAVHGAGTGLGVAVARRGNRLDALVEQLAADAGNAPETVHVNAPAPLKTFGADNAPTCEDGVCHL